MNPLGINDVDNEVLNDADQYLRQHKILELFEVSCLVCIQPSTKRILTSYLTSFIILTEVLSFDCGLN